MEKFSVEPTKEMEPVWIWLLLLLFLQTFLNSANPSESVNAIEWFQVKSGRSDLRSGSLTLQWKTKQAQSVLFT